MSNLQFNSLINLSLTQESGQTSQSPWTHNSVGNMEEFSELIYLNIPSIINELSDETINLNKLPILLKLSQDKNDLNSFGCIYQLPKKVNKKEFSLNFDNFSNQEIKAIENEIEDEIK